MWIALLPLKPLHPLNALPRHLRLLIRATDQHPMLAALIPNIHHRFPVPQTLLIGLQVRREAQELNPSYHLLPQLGAFLADPSRENDGVYLPAEFHEVAADVADDAVDKDVEGESTRFVARGGFFDDDAEVGRSRESLPPWFVVENLLRLRHVHFLGTTPTRLSRLMREMENQTRVHIAAPGRAGQPR